MRKLILSAVAAGLAPLVAGCGFTPLYATHEAGVPQGLLAVHFAGVSASEEAADAVTRAFRDRTARAGAPAQYDLSISVTETAQPLAVQIDNSVTRFNYQMKGKYTLTRRSDGKSFSGKAMSVASFNIVNSQYSTLFAENAARDKAARMLAEEVERDILVKLDMARGAQATAARGE
ncbi:MAG: hypothetical protein GC153_01135 [Alphaproteobacteria bacterium]|nr:hypothetical protein [Alphaproteobacteria bacterium]